MNREEITAMQTTFTGFKSALDRLEIEMKANGTASSESLEKLAKFNAKFDDLEKQINARMDQIDQLAAFKTSVEAKMVQIEAGLSRKGRFSNAGEVETEARRQLGMKWDALEKVLRKGIAPNALKSSDELTPEEVKALTVSSNPQAGYLAPREYLQEILTDVVEWSPVRPLCRIRTTGRQGIEIPRRITPAAASWVSETGTRSETQNPQFTMEVIPTHELYAMVQVSAQEMEDSLFDLQSFLREEFAEQFGVSEGTAFVDGSGVGRPEGFMQNADVTSVVSEHASEITADGLLNVYHELKEAYLANSTWVMARSTLKEIRKLKDGNGNYLWAPGIKMEARPAQLLDRPYVTAPDMPTIAANAYPVAIGDFRRAYTILDRLEMSIMVDPYTAKRTGMIEISARKRVGGKVVMAEAIKKLKISA